MILKYRQIVIFKCCLWQLIIINNQMDIPLTMMNTLVSFSSSGDSEVFAPEVAKVKESKSGKSKNPSMKFKNVGHWNPIQKELYYVFLTAHRENFLRKELRRTDKIFKEMAKFVKTRAADQCRSHHQKMEKKFLTFDEILNSMRDSGSGKDYSQLLKTFQNEETKHMSPQMSSTSEPIETEKPVVQNAVQFELESQPMSYDAIDELEMAINSPGLFSDDAIDIDNYFLM